MGVCAVCSFSQQKCHHLVHSCFVFLSFPFLFRILDRERLVDTARSTNKQTNKQWELKRKKSRSDEMWQRVFSSVWLMACNSHYSLLCPLPPIGHNNTAWPGCQHRVISHFCLTARTMRAVSHQDQLTTSYSSGSCICSRWKRSFAIDLITNKLSNASMRSD